MTVKDSDLMVAEIVRRGRDGHGRLDVLHLPGAGVRVEIGSDDAIEHLGWVFFVADIIEAAAEVAAVPPAGTAVGQFEREGFIVPVPDEAAVELRKFPDQLPIFEKITGRIPLGVGIFAKDDRAGFASGRKDFSEDVGRWVHGGKEVADGGARVAAFVLNRASGVGLSDPSGHRGMMRAGAGFISEGPEQDGGVVAVAENHSDRPGHIGMDPHGIVGECAFDSMRFEICFVHQVEAEFVAQVIPAGIVRIVAGTDGVEIELFHRENIAAHIVFRQGPASFGVELVAVDATEHEALAV